MLPAYSADSNSSYEQSNDETLHLVHSRNPHQVSYGAASVEGQHLWNTYAPPQIPSANTQYSASLHPGQTQSTYQSSPAAALGYFPPLSVSVTLPPMPFPQPVPLQITLQPSVGVGYVPQLNISINLPQIPSAVPYSFPTWPGQLQLPSEPALADIPQSHDRNRLDQTPGGSTPGSASTSTYPGQDPSTESRSFDTAFGNGQQLYDSSAPHQGLHPGQEQQYTSRRLKDGLVSASERYTSSPVGSDQSKITKLPSFRSLFGSPTLGSRLVSINETHCLSPRDSDMTSSLKRTGDEIYPSGSEFDHSHQSPNAPSFEDAPRPRKRLNLGSTSCFSEGRIQSLAAPSHYPDSHNLKSLSVDGCRISQDQRMDLPVRRDLSIDHYETQNGTSMLRDARNVRISGHPTFTNIGVNNVTNHSGAHDLEILTKFVSFSALHDSSVQDPDRRCHPGTRANVLARLQVWADDPSASEHIVWVHGLPGAGKSSVAQTIIRKCGREKVVATFFFYRSDPGRNDGNRLFTTIAWQLASSIPCVKACLVNSLNRRPDLPMKDVETQFEELVVQPFHALNDSAYYLDLPLTPVVVIDGVDECTDENLQQRFLNVIGKAIRDCRVPLRFLILSRPEAHIKEIVDQFECSTLRIDLDNIDNANHDIERYFNAEFSRIADEQDIDPTWPGDRVIQELVCNSSGQFVYAATVTKYVGDKLNCAKSQLDTILGLRKRASASPFAPLDVLYTEILKRQPDQDFLKEILVLLVACSSIDDGDDFHADFPTLLNVSKEDVDRKLRGMQSLLAFEEDSRINIHHRSFLDFLEDLSRSGQYHISKRASLRRYLELITDTIVRYVSNIIDQPQCHDTQHLHLECLLISRLWFSSSHEPAVKDVIEVLQPLVGLQDKLLNLRNLPSCDQCYLFEMMRNLLLHLALSQAKSYCITSPTRATGPSEHEGDYKTIAALHQIAPEKNVPDKDLDTDFASLLDSMRNMPSTSSPTAYVLKLMYSLLHFDCAEIAKKVCSVLEAQNLVNLLYYFIHGQNSITKGDMNLTCKAIYLVREICARVPVLPQSLLLIEDASLSDWNLDVEDFEIETLCNRALVSSVLKRHFILCHGLMLEKDGGLSWAVDRRIMDTDNVLQWGNTSNVSHWSRASNPSHNAKFQVMLELSKSFQYFHSVGLVLSYHTPLLEIFLDPEFRPRIHIWYLDIEEVKLNKFAYERSVFTFGRLFYEMYFNIELPQKKGRFKLKRKRPSKPEIREDAWELIQLCCAKNPENRPTIDEVVQVMESWNIESEIAMPTSSSGWLVEDSPL